MQTQRNIAHATETATLADILERILDKGIVIAGDIKIKLVDIELLTIQIRLLIASVEKAKEMGMDWWVTNKDLVSGRNKEVESLKERVNELEKAGGNGKIMKAQMTQKIDKDKSVTSAAILSKNDMAEIESVKKMIQELEIVVNKKGSETGSKTKHANKLEKIKSHFRDILKGSE